MKKIMNVMMLIGAGLTVCSCSGKKTELPGTFTYKYMEDPSFELFDTFIYETVDVGPERLIKKKSPFNYEAIKEDFLMDDTYLKEYSSYFFDSVSRESSSDYGFSCKHIWNYDKTETCFVTLENTIMDEILKNPERYYTAEAISDLKKLSSDEMSAEEFIEIYGDHYIDYYQKENFSYMEINITDINEMEDTDAKERISENLLISNYSLEKSNMAEKDMEKYDVSLFVYSTVPLETYEDYIAYRDGGFLNQEYHHVALGGEELVFPKEYSASLKLIPYISEPRK